MGLLELLEVRSRFYSIHLSAFLQYRTFVEQNYKEPVNGKFIDDTNQIIKSLGGSQPDEEESGEEEETEEESNEL